MVREDLEEHALGDLVTEGYPRARHPCAKGPAIAGDLVTGIREDLPRPTAASPPARERSSALMVREKLEELALGKIVAGTLEDLIE